VRGQQREQRTSAQSVGQLLVNADVIAVGGGEFRVIPRKPGPANEEVGTTAAARILGYKCRSSIHEEVLNHPQAHLIHWRYTAGGGKVLINLQSLLAFKAATSETKK